MAEKRKLNREEAAEFFNKHDIDEIDSEEIEVEVRKPLSASISMRIDKEYLEKLRLLAKVNDLGVTTMARRLLYQALDNPGNQLFLHALKGEETRTVIYDTVLRYPLEEPQTFFILSPEDLQQTGELAGKTFLRLLLEAIKEHSLAVSEEASKDLYEKLKEFEEIHS